MGSHIFGFFGVRRLHINGYQTYRDVCTVGENESVLYSVKKKKKEKKKERAIHKNRKWLSRDRKNYIFAQKCILLTK